MSPPSQSDVRTPLSIEKGRRSRKNDMGCFSLLCEKIENIGVKNVQTAGYNGARTIIYIPSRIPAEMGRQPFVEGLVQSSSRHNPVMSFSKIRPPENMTLVGFIHIQCF